MSLLKRIKRVLQAQANTPTNEVEEFEPERLVADRVLAPVLVVEVPPLVLVDAEALVLHRAA